MDQVFLKTRELGMALTECDVYKHMKECEEKAMANTEAAEMMGRYIEQRTKLQAMLSESDPDSEEIKKISDEMDSLQEQLQLIDDVSNLTLARKNFNDLINQVNQVLEFIVTGKIDDSEGGCTGSCATCGGACQLS